MKSDFRLGQRSMQILARNSGLAINPDVWCADGDQKTTKHGQIQTSAHGKCGQIGDTGQRD